MDNIISQESINSLNEFMANYERERDARKACEEQARKDAYERAMRKQTELESDFSYKVVMIAKDLLKLAGDCLAGIAKFMFVTAALLSPYIIEAIIDKCL